MPFRTTGLSPEPFRALFGLPEAELAARHIRRVLVDRAPAYPDRIELRDAEPGETVLLLNHVSLPEATPYRATHAIYVREGAQATHDAVGGLPAMLRRRLLSLRGFDAAHMMVEAEVAEGEAAAPVIERLLGNPRVAYLHAHFAKAGCFAARITRA
jgi:hypothetical protein